MYICVSLTIKRFTTMKIQVNIQDRTVETPTHTLSFFEAGINTNIDGKDESSIDKDEITEMLEEKFGENIQVDFIK